YLPFIALHLKKQRGKKMIVEERSKFTAATQMIYLKMLYSLSKKFEIDQLADELELSKMTVLRAVEELQNKNLVAMEIGGQTRRKKLIYPIEKKEYYRIGQQYLINPVKKTIYVRALPEGTKRFRSGLTALAEKTLLAEPKREMLAVYENVGRLKTYQITKEEALEEELPDIQIMCYDIGKLTNNHSVDPITLIMSLDERDERVAMAIEELMEGYEWFKG
ncbi:MAG: HTH domain-containing protein, partial [Firmicutes bacterium]|nr:HTH domain-containing protein [Bacillota bacterium]